MRISKEFACVCRQSQNPRSQETRIKLYFIGFRRKKHYRMKPPLGIKPLRMKNVPSKIAKVLRSQGECSSRQQDPIMEQEEQMTEDVSFYKFLNSTIVSRTVSFKKFDFQMFPPFLEFKWYSDPYFSCVSYKYKNKIRTHLFRGWLSSNVPLWIVCIPAHLDRTGPLVFFMRNRSQKS